jgi:short-subunit dehydrogenase
MTEGMAGHEKMASVEAVAKDIVNGIEKGKSCVYTPRVWQLIMLVVRNIPNKIFSRLKL